MSISTTPVGHALAVGADDFGFRKTPGPRAARRSPEWIAEHVLLAAIGDRRAWREIVEEFDGMLSAVARSHRLRHADIADVTQTTWLRLAENLDRLKEPSRVGAWLAMTTRRECLRVLRASTRELIDEQPPEPADTDIPPIDGHLLEAERNAALWSAFGRLPVRDQALLRMVFANPQPSYEQIGTTLGMPIGSIGPTRARALERLRREFERSEALSHLG